MAITFPRTDIMTTVDFSADTVPLQLLARQELSRTAYGRTIGKSLGSAIWLGEFTTVPLPNADALVFEAMLNSLDGVTGVFEAGDMRSAAQYPRAYPTGAFNDTGVLASVNANNKALALSGLDAGMQLSVGSYLSFTYGDSRALHQVMEAVTANGSGVTSQFEVRPFLRAGWTVGAAVRLKSPRGLFTLQPGTLAARMNDSTSSVVSFKAVQCV
jgi:hypothetical protein